MKKNLIKVVSAAALFATLTACGKTKTVEKKVEWTEAEKIQWATENGYVQVEEEINYATTPTLEIAFSDTYEQISGAHLNTRLSQQQNIAVVIGVDGCSGCANLKASGELDKFQEETGYKIYYYEYVAEEAVGQWIKENVFANDSVLGPTLVAFTYDNENAQMSKVAGKWVDVSTNTAAQLRTKLETVYTFETDEIIDFTTNAELGTLETLKDVFDEYLTGEQSIMFFSRYTCPACQQVKNTNNLNFITRLAKDTDGEGLRMFYILSDILRTNIVSADNKTLDDAVTAYVTPLWTNENTTKEELKTWLGEANGEAATWDATNGKWVVGSKDASAVYKVANASDLIIYNVVLGHIVYDATMMTEEGYLNANFWEAVTTFAKATGAELEETLGEDVANGKMYYETRITPVFLAVNYGEWDNEYIIDWKASREHNHPIQSFHNLPRMYGLKPELKEYPAMALEDYVETLYLRMKMFIDTWAKTEPAA